MSVHRIIFAFGKSKSHQLDQLKTSFKCFKDYYVSVPTEFQQNYQIEIIIICNENVNKSLPAKKVAINNAHNTLSEILFIFAI